MESFKPNQMFVPVNNLPSIGQIGHYLYDDKHLLLDIDGADHLM